MAQNRFTKEQLLDEKSLAYKYIYEEALLGLDLTDLNSIRNPLYTRNRFLIDNPQIHLLYLFKQPEYVAAACKYLLNVDCPPYQSACLYSLWTHSFPFMIATRGGSKTFMLAVYCMLMATLQQGIKIVCIGAGLRQSRHVFEYASRIWNGSPLLRSLFASAKQEQGPKWQQDRFIIRLGESAISFLPIGDGEKIRGERASIIIIDELQSQNPEILERVVYGFAAVSRDPVKNAKRMAKYRKLKDAGYKVDAPQLATNQIILAGTAYYQFNHIYQYYTRYRDKIQHKLGKDYKEHCLIRIPFELIPEGIMDTAIIEKAREGGITGVSEMEYGAVFSRDSDGFFKASLINNAVAKPQNSIYVEGVSGAVEFYPAMSGRVDCQYVIAVDPASERDNLSIVVIEVLPTHRRIVYCWATNKQDYRDKFTNKLTSIDGYYSYCAQKLRQLSKSFLTDIIVIESQGGGYAIMEALNEEKNMKQGESKWWPVINSEKPQISDGYAGLHNIYVIQPSDADWMYNANHDLKKDIENRVLLFPYSNPIDYAIIGAEPQKGVETIEDVTIELEELKAELIIIEHSKTPTGRDKWDLPKQKIAGQTKPLNQLRKDRYSALLMCNSVARTIYKKEPTSNMEYRCLGMGLAEEQPKTNGEWMYVGHYNYSQALGQALRDYTYAR